MQHDCPPLVPLLFWACRCFQCLSVADRVQSTSYLSLQRLETGCNDVALPSMRLLNERSGLRGKVFMWILAESGVWGRAQDTSYHPQPWILTPYTLIPTPTLCQAPIYDAWWTWLADHQDECRACSMFGNR